MVAALVAACGGSASPAPSQAGFSSLPTDSHNICVTPGPEPQDVTLPTTGGVTGTISFDAYPAGASGCDNLQIATGSAVEIPPPIAWSGSGIRLVASADRRPVIRLAAVVTPPTPILTISVGEGLQGNPIFGSTTIVTGMTLTGSPENLPDGTYYATITTIYGQRSTVNSVIPFIAKNGVLTVAPIALPNGKNFPVIISAATSSIIVLYARGVPPPEAYQSPIPTSSSAPTSASPKPSISLPPIVTAQPIPNAYGFPPPAGGPIGIYAYDWAGCTGNPGCSGDGMIQQQNGGGTMQVPTGMWGTITFSADIGYMGIYEPIVKDCPLDWTVIALPSGGGSIIIPYSDPLATPPQNSLCTITYQTVPPGANGSGYEEVLSLLPIGIGDVTIEGQPSVAP